MKIAIILLSMLSAAGTWWWNVHRRHGRPSLTFTQQLKNAVKSMLAGVVVYFALMTLTLLYLMITTA